MIRLGKLFITPTTWRDRYKRDYLRELINRQRLKAGGVRTIQGWQLNEIIVKEMELLKTSKQIDALESLIEKVRNGEKY